MKTKTLTQILLVLGFILCATTPASLPAQAMQEYLYIPTQNTIQTFTQRFGKWVMVDEINAPMVNHVITRDDILIFSDDEWLSTASLEKPWDPHYVDFAQVFEGRNTQNIFSKIHILEDNLVAVTARTFPGETGIAIFRVTDEGITTLLSTEYYPQWDYLMDATSCGNSIFIADGNGWPYHLQTISIDIYGGQHVLPATQIGQEIRQFLPDCVNGYILAQTYEGTVMAYELDGNSLIDQYFLHDETTSYDNTYSGIGVVGNHIMATTLYPGWDSTVIRLFEVHGDTSANVLQKVVLPNNIDDEYHIYRDPQAYGDQMLLMYGHPLRYTTSKVLFVDISSDNVVFTDSIAVNMRGSRIATYSYPIVAQDNVCDLIAYPNPTESRTTVAIDPELNLNEVSLFDPSGRLVGSASITKGFGTLNLENLPTGIYMLSVTGCTTKITRN